MHGVQIMAHLLYYVYVLYVVQNVRESLTLYDAMEVLLAHERKHCYDWKRGTVCPTY